MEIYHEKLWSVFRPINNFFNTVIILKIKVLYTHSTILRSDIRVGFDLVSVSPEEEEDSEYDRLLLPMPSGRDSLSVFFLFFCLFFLICRFLLLQTNSESFRRGGGREDVDDSSSSDEESKVIPLLNSGGNAIRDMCTG